MKSMAAPGPVGALLQLGGCSLLMSLQRCWEMVGEIANFSGPFVETLLWASFSYKVHVVEVTPGIPRNNNPTDCTRSQPHPMAERWKSGIIKMRDADLKQLRIFSWWHFSGMVWQSWLQEYVLWSTSFSLLWWFYLYLLRKM